MLQQNWMNVVDAKTGAVSQVWFDDVASLTVKYDAARDLRGVGVWTPNMLDYGPAPYNDSSMVPKATRDMWTAVSTRPFL